MIPDWLYHRLLAAGTSIGRVLYLALDMAIIAAVVALIWLLVSAVAEAQTVITEDHDAFAQLERAIMDEEGFRSKPYRDILGVETVGFGTNLAQGITREEGRYLMRGRLMSSVRALASQWPRLADLNLHVQAALADMSYQLGVRGVMGFHAMLACLEVEPPDLECAHDEALDSMWARVTPNRARRVTDRMLVAP